MILTNSSAAKVGGTDVKVIASTTASFRQFMVYAATTISAEISGAKGLVKNGNGTLTLSGSNTYTGATTISGGTLAVNNSYLTPSYTINSGAVLNLGYSPTASLTLLGNGTLNIVGVVQAIVPPLAISMGGGLIDIKSTGGVLAYGYGNDPWTGNLADLNVSGVLYIAANNVIVNTLTGNSAYFTVGAATIIVGVNNGSGTYTGTLSRNYADGSFRKEGSGTQTMNGTINLGATGTITQIGSGNLVINGAILSGSIVQNGTGALTLTGNNTYAGGTVFAAGSITYSNANAFGTGLFTFQGAGIITTAGGITLPNNFQLNSGSQLQFRTSGAPNTGVSGNIAGNGGIWKGNNGTLTLSGNLTYTGATTIQAGFIRAKKTVGASTATARFQYGGLSLSVSFDVAPPSGTTSFRFFQGTTTQTYIPTTISLSGVPFGTTATYNSTLSTLSVIVP